MSAGVTISVVYGAAALVYERGALDWTGWIALAPMGSTFWLLPLTNFSILVGIALDYGSHRRCAFDDGDAHDHDTACVARTLSIKTC